MTESQLKAVEYFNQAIAADPTFALAYAELAARYEILYASSILDPRTFKPKAEAAAQKALELDENLADAHYALANLKRSIWDWAAAEREYQRAIDLNPNLAEAHSFYAFYLMNRGRFEEAIAEAQRARELDPLSMFKNAHVGNALTCARRYDEAIDWLKKTLEMDRNFGLTHFYLGVNYLAKGRYAEAFAAYEESLRLDARGPGGRIYLGAAYARGGERKKAQQIQAELQASKEYVSPAELAILYAALGDREQAFASLEKAYREHDLQLQFLIADASYDALRNDLRFQDLLRRVGLPVQNP